MEHSYIALDIETTGLNPKKDKIIEIGALRIRDNAVEARFHSLIYPGRELNESITALTGITDEMVAQRPEIQEMIGTVVDFCQELPLLGHRILFDYSFLKRAAVNQGIRWEQKGIDTLKLCRRFMPKEESKTLANACRFYQIKAENCHRAMWDAYAAHVLYQKLANQYQESFPESFQAGELIYKVKKEQPASKGQKELLQELLKYHKIKAPVQIGALTRNEASRLTDEIISKYGRMEARIWSTKSLKEVRKV